MKIDLNDRHVELLSKRHIDLPRNIINISEKSRIGNMVKLINIDSYYDFSIGSFSYSWSTINSFIGSIGRYCSIAAQSNFGDMEHPTQWLSTSSFVYDRDFIWKRWKERHSSSFEPRILPVEAKRHPIHIGNDVWIGARVYVRGGVTIGDGAIIGTQAVITKDVEPYSIVVGNPGVVKKKRFSDSIIYQLLDLKWWNYNYLDFAGIDFTDIEAAILHIKSKIRMGEIKPYDESITIGEIVNCIES